jgi:hypothetical protein
MTLTVYSAMTGKVKGDQTAVAWLRRLSDGCCSCGVPPQTDDSQVYVHAHKLLVGRVGDKITDLLDRSTAETPEEENGYRVDSTVIVAHWSEWTDV